MEVARNFFSRLGEKERRTLLRDGARLREARRKKDGTLEPEYVYVVELPH